MSIWIKICANTSLEDALLAAEAGADAVGFVFAPSPRRVTAAEVAAITPRLPATVEKIGVFVDAALEEIVSTVQACGLTGVQLHYDADPDLPAKLHERLGPELRILRVMHFARGNRRTVRDSDCRAHTRPARGRGAGGLAHSRGRRRHGVTFDWTAARKATFPKRGSAKAPGGRGRAESGQRGRSHRRAASLGRGCSLRR
jgi:phosphoribosylanthranilate isomerase